MSGVDTGRVRIADVLVRLSERVELLDVAIEAKPLDELIASLYKEHRI